MKHVHGHRSPYQDESPDKLLDSINIKLTTEQRKFLNENKDTLRTLLHKKFNLKFGTTYSKMQITRALEVMNEPKFKPVFKRNPNKTRNIYYKPRRKCWEARITVNKIRHFLYIGSEEGAIKAVAEFKAKHGIKW